jgi:cell division protease FtsH
VPLAADVDPRTIARGTPGFSGADLANLVNEAALLAARRNKRTVAMAEFEDAKDKVMMGAERRSMVMSDEERKLTAYHEGGHALVALNLEASDPIHKATIIPRGRALGMVMRLPERDQLSVTRAKLKADLAVAMGGRIAEEVIFGHEKVTSGASSDIQMATNMAKAMVTQFGMSEKLGPVLYSENDEEVFLGRSVQKHKNVSEETAKAIDSEIKKLIDKAYAKTKEILNDNIKDLHTLAKGLIEYETLELDEIKELLKNGSINRANPEDEIKNAGPSVPKSGKPKSELGPDFKPKPQTS